MALASQLREVGREIAALNYRGWTLADRVEDLRREFQRLRRLRTDADLALGAWETPDTLKGTEWEHQNKSPGAIQDALFAAITNAEREVNQFWADNAQRHKHLIAFRDHLRVAPAPHRTKAHPPVLAPQTSTKSQASFSHLTL